ncbi:MAG: hypothetical protein GY807_21040 [Gammaproteobacteria bacterium]|nr:hypothetical protein [Gammaproteobacteria bacterium]
MIDENAAVSSEEDENTESTTETVDPTDNPVAQAETTDEAAEQGDKPGDDAAKAEIEAEDSEKALDKKPNRKTASQRIGELTQIRRDQEREIARLNAQLERTQKLERPDPEKYVDPDEYTSDLAAYKIRTSQTDDLQAGVQDAKTRAGEVLIAAHQERVMDFSHEAPDFHQVAGDPSLQITPNMANEIMDSEFGPQIQYALGKNPREAARISQLSQTRQIREIGRLEAEVSRPAPKRVTQAPAPIKPVAGNSKPRLSYSEDMSMEDYAKMRAAGRNP